MATSDNKSKIAAVVATILFLLALGWGIFQLRVNDSLQKEVNAEKLISESILSEKLSVEKEINKIKGQMASIEAKNNELNSSLATLSGKLSDKEKEAERIRRESNANKKKYSELDLQKKKLEEELASLNNTIQQLQASNTDLTNSVAALQKQNQNLSEELEKAHLAYYDKPMIEAVRGKKDKLVAKAARTKKLRATVMVPGNLKEVEFKIINPDGQVISNTEDGTLATRVVNNNINLVSASGKTTPSNTFKQMEMVFVPKKKLKAGVYQIEVVSENLAVGNLQIKLR